MATPSPLNFNQRNKAASPRGFASMEEYAAHHAALNSGPTGMHEKNTIQSGPHKGQTPDQVYAQYLDAGKALGLPSRVNNRDGSNGTLLLGQSAAVAASPTPQPMAASPVAQTTGTGGQLVPGRSAGSMVWKPNTSTQPAATESTAQPAKTAPSQSPVSSTPAAVPISKAPSPRAKSFDGMPATQFGANYAAREGRGNAFTGYKVPTQTSPSVTPTPKAAAPSGVAPSYNPTVAGTFMAEDALSRSSPTYNTAHSIPGAPILRTSPNNPVAEGGGMAAAALQTVSPSYAATHTPAAVSPVTPADPSMGPAQKGSAAPQAPLNGMQIMTPEVARAAKAADPTPAPVAASPSTSTARLAPIPLGATPFSSSAGIKNNTGKEVAAGLLAGAVPPPPKPAGTPLSAVKPYAQVAARPSTMLKPTLSLSGRTSTPLLAGARAEGGPVQGGKPYLVGERGPSKLPARLTSP